MVEDALERLVDGQQFRHWPFSPSRVTAGSAECVDSCGCVVVSVSVVLGRVRVVRQRVFPRVNGFQVGQTPAPGTTPGRSLRVRAP